MLFKVWATEAFADEPGRIGVIEAESLAHAVAQLQAWSSKTLQGTDYEQLGWARTTWGRGQTQVIFRVRDTDGNVGQDSYMLLPHEGPLMFLAEDWKQIFS